MNELYATEYLQQSIHTIPMTAITAKSTKKFNKSTKKIPTVR